jgi:peptidoglycan/LPS O-acetylase OafA/YrhL
MTPEEGRRDPASSPDSRQSAASTGPLAEPARFDTLDALRGVAAIMVVIYHANPTGPIFGHRLFSAGSLFVDFFFVLSGFVIAAAYGDRLAAGFSRARFLWLRVGRVWPVHAVVLLAYLGVELIVLLSGSGLITGREAFGPERRPGDFLIQFLLLHAFYPPALYDWLLQSWSIAIEMMLYLLVALGWPLARRGWAWLSLAVGLLAGAWLWLDDSAMLYAHQRGLFGFGLGVGAWLAWQRLGQRLAGLSRGVATLIEAGLVLAIAACLATGGGELTRLVYVPLFALVVLAFAAQRGGLSDLLRRAGR